MKKLTDNQIVNLIVAFETLLESIDNELDYIKENGYQDDDWSLDFKQDIKKAQSLLDKAL